MISFPPVTLLAYSWYLLILYNLDMSTYFIFINNFHGMLGRFSLSRISEWQAYPHSSRSNEHRTSTVIISHAYKLAYGFHSHEDDGVSGSPSSLFHVWGDSNYHRIL